MLWQKLHTKKMFEGKLKKYFAQEFNFLSLIFIHYVSLLKAIIRFPELDSSVLIFYRKSLNYGLIM